MAILPSASLTRLLAWVTGANGLIGNYVVQTASKYAPHWNIRALTRSQIDLLDFAAVEREFLKDQPQLIIHCAAISAVADAQKNPELAQRVNVEVTRQLAEVAAGIPFVFFSTDLVFDGRQGNYTEQAAPNPLHCYGETKVAAEQLVLRNPKHVVVRTSMNGGTSLSGNRSFNESLRNSWQAGKESVLFTDEFRCPIHAAETARAVWTLVEKKCTGIYHIAGAERLSRFQIGQLLAARWPGLDARLVPDSLKNHPNSQRPPDVSLNITKVQKILSAPLPGLTEWLVANPNVTF